MKAAQLAKWSIAILITMLLLWRVISVNFAQHAANLMPEDALRWQQMTSDLALQQAVETMQVEPEVAYQAALRNAWQWPTDPRHFILLGMMLENKGNTAGAADLFNAVDRIYQRRPDVQLQTGHFWARQGKVRQAVTHWGAAMEMQPALRQDIFPDLLTLAELPQYHQAFSLAFANAGTWADTFFIHAVSTAAELDTLKMLYQARMKSKQSPSPEMRRVYIERLFQQNKWTDAYFIWLNSLEPAAIAKLGNVFDGGFEIEEPEQGFAWRFSRSEGLRLQAEPTMGAGGKQALHVSFMGTHRVKTVIVSQRLLLDPGPHELRGKVRVDNLAAVNGLRWEIHCPGRSEPIVQTAYYVDKTRWKNFAESFVVPEGCEAPMLSLILHPSDARRNNLTGSIWFDDLAITFRVPS